MLQMCSSTTKRISGGSHKSNCTSGRPDFCLTLLLLGDYGTGKSSLMQVVSGKTRVSPRYVKSFCPVSIQVPLIRGQKDVRIKIVDSGGQEKFRSLTASYYRGAHGCLVLFDVTKESTFDNLTYWLHDLKEYSTYPEISTILVGTRCHVPPEQRQVSTERAEKYAESVGLPYMEVSAEEGKNVTEVFEKLADIIIDKFTAGQREISSSIILERTKQKKKSVCSC